MHGFPSIRHAIVVGIHRRWRADQYRVVAGRSNLPCTVTDFLDNPGVHGIAFRFRGPDVWEDYGFEFVG